MKITVVYDNEVREPELQADWGFSCFIEAQGMPQILFDTGASGSILLRPYRLSDTNHLYDAVRESIDELSVWMPWCHANYSIKEAKTWLKTLPKAWDNGLAYEFVITGSKDSSYLGACSLTGINHENRYANLSYWVRTSRTKRGVATTAALLLARFGLSELKLNRIEIVVATDNKASQRVAEKIGATREGVLRNLLVVRDRVYDAVMFSLIPSDLNPKSLI